MTALTETVDYAVRDGVAVITVDNPPVNALSQSVRQGILEAVTAALDDDDVGALLLACDGRTFIAGADITEFAKAPQEPDLHSVLDAIDRARKPVVAAIHGTALGGGLETALCCHYRVAESAARLGLPEVNLGLLPGAGGTQRLPRAIGAEKAAEMVTSGQPIGAAEALELGLVDRIVDGELREDAEAFARGKIGTSELPRLRDRDDKLLAARDNPALFEALRKTLARKSRGALAPEYNLRCIEAAVNQPFDEGMATESRLFRELMARPQSRAQQYFFFSERQAARVPGIGRDTAEIPIASTGVIGAGTMGGGIAMNMANIGLPVTIVETSAEALERGLGIIRRNYENTASKGRISRQDVETRCGLISGSLDLGDLGACDLVIEAVFEDMAVKKDIFTRLDGIAKPGAILASNTSALDLNEIAAVTGRPESVIGLHFFSPANVMKLLEVVRGDETSDTVIKTCMAFAKRIAKVPVLVGVCHGFVGNRILFQRQHQAMRLAHEGAAPHDIDRVLCEFGFPMGAFQMSDLAGLDIGWSAETSTGSTVRERLCEMGRRGQKSGAGYYDYDENRRPTPNPEVAALFEEFAQKEGIERRDISDEEILERCLLPMINEGAKILQEGIAQRASDIDVVYVYGYGWPAHRGGPMYHADRLGLDHVLERLAHYAGQGESEFWQPAQLLQDLARSGGSLT
ncbi:MAG: 3-hydroxyacyl-CoA dehydrogenase NAD-binding domain-containing protein [Halioglobus sp.]|nr:3-hydroxyacyl-CoA dehydrogenase NAD-binding domain-containing protein [Halioglobus sp.]